MRPHRRVTRWTACWRYAPPSANVAVPSHWTTTVVFHGHPDLRRILMPEDYEGFPQRRDFPVGGEPILFTVNDARGTDYTQ